MIILSRKFIIPKAYDEVYDIIKSRAYYISKSKFTENDFSMYCSQRYGENRRSLHRVSGTITHQDDTCYVSVYTHADLSFFLGCILCLCGVFGLLGCLIYFTRVYASLGLFAFGLILLISSLTGQKDILDRFEQKFRTQLQVEITVLKK